MIKVAFLIRSLDYGGAQRQLVELARGLDAARFAITIFYFYPAAPLADELRRQNTTVKLVCLNKHGRWDVAIFLRRLLAELRKLRPDILHGYLDVPNILVALIKPFLPGTKIVWGVRATSFEKAHLDRFTRLTLRMAARLAKRADLIIFNSRAGRAAHLADGYPPAKAAAIPNGIDTARFCPDVATRDAQRAAWHIASHEKLIGIVGRLDPVKDHATFIRAAALIADARADVKFVCVGDGAQEYRDDLQKLAAESGIAEKVLWAQAEPDAAKIYNALDALVSASVAEGFSNTLAEALACGVACVATDVGDARLIIEDAARIVPPRNPALLAQAILNLLGRSADPQFAERARRHICENFSLSALQRNTERAFDELLASRARIDL